MKEKAKIYAHAGIGEYWVVNLRRGLLIVMREPDRESGEHGSRVTLSEGTVQPLAFPDVAIDVSCILRTRF